MMLDVVFDAMAQTQHVTIRRQWWTAAELCNSGDAALDYRPGGQGPTLREAMRRRMSKIIQIVLFTILIGAGAAAGRAAEAYREQMKGLDEQVQEVKSDVLSIAAQLN